jgi:hypothetical protein
MATREVPRSDWRQELDLFSREHEGTPARLEIRDTAGPRTEARDLPFQGASADSPQSSRIAISMGDAPDDHVTHEISDAVSVTIDDTERPGGRLEVKGADGTTATVEFGRRS